MKLIIELDLASPEHRNAHGVFRTLGALTKALQDRIPGGARLEQVLESHPNDGALVLAESAYDPTNSGDTDYVITCPMNLRATVSNEEFDTTCLAAESAKAANVGLSFDQITVAIDSTPTHNSILSGLKKANP